MGSVIRYCIPEDVECRVPGWPRLRYFITPGIGCAEIRDRELNRDKFYVIPHGLFHGIYNNK